MTVGDLQELTAAFLEEAAFATRDVADVWIEHATEIVRRLDPPLLDAWAEQTLPFVMDHARNKLQPVRFLEHVSGVARNEVGHWLDAGIEPTPVRRATTTPVVGPWHSADEVVLDLHRPGIQHDRRVITEDVRTARWDLPVLADLRATQLQALGWRDDVVVWAHDVSWVSLPDARVITYREDPRGGILFGEDEFHSDLTFSEFLLDLLRHYARHPREGREPVAIALTSTCPTAYYHELIDTFGSLSHVPPGLRELPIITPVRYEPLAELYRAAGVAPRQVRSYSEVAHLNFDVLVAPVLTPSSREKMSFIREAGGRIEGPDEGEALVYISRSRSTARRMVNEESVEDVFRAFGFRIAYLEELDVPGQVRLLRSARVIAGPHGAGLANMPFAPSGSLVIELVPEWYASPVFFNQAYGCGDPYLPIVGQDASAGGELAWSVSTELVTEVLRGLQHAGAI